MTEEFNNYESQVKEITIKGKTPSPFNALKSEAEGSPSKKGEFPKGVKEASASPFPSYFKRYVALLIIILLLLALVFLLLSSKDGQKCLSNPLVYGAEQISSDITGAIFCSCSFTNPKYAPFYFNKHNLTIGVP